MWGCQVSPGRDSPTAPLWPASFPRTRLSTLFPGPLSPAPANLLTHPAPPQTPHPAPSTQSLWLVPALRSPQRTLFCLRFFLPPRSFLQAETVACHLPQSWARWSSSARCPESHQAASVGSWAGLRLVVLADTSGTLASTGCLSSMGVSDKGTQRLRSPASQEKAKSEVTEHPPSRLLVEVDMSPPVQGEGQEDHLPREECQEFVVSHGLWWGRNI